MIKINHQQLKSSVGCMAFFVMSCTLQWQCGRNYVYIFYLLFNDDLKQIVARMNATLNALTNCAQINHFRKYSVVWLLNESLCQCANIFSSNFSGCMKLKNIYHIRKILGTLLSTFQFISLVSFILPNDYILFSCFNAIFLCHLRKRILNDQRLV